MAWGGGSFLTQNKILGGAYINFISKAVPSATLLDRGIVAFGFDLDWGVDDKIFEVTEADILKQSAELFGYDYASEKLAGVKDILKNSVKLYAYKLNNGGTKATNTYATAKYNGVRGNDLKVVIQNAVDVDNGFIVSLYLGTVLVDKQIVKKANELVNNAWVDWKTDASLQLEAGIKLEGGNNGSVSAAEHQKFVGLCESYPDINAIGYAGGEEEIKQLYAAWAKNMREEVGVKVQAVLHQYVADNEAVVNVENEALDTNKAALVYWATGVIAGTAVNKSATNKKYDGEFEIKVDYTQSELEKCLKAGKWTLHRVGSDIKVLEDINSLTTVTVDKGEIFKDNQTIRIIDQIATAVANVFTSKYLGQVPNDKDGRLSLWADVCKVHSDLEAIRALEDFDPKDITVEQGDAKKSVVINESITIVNTMVRLYMTVVVG